MVKPCASRLPGYLNSYFLRTISKINKLKNVKAKPKQKSIETKSIEFIGPDSFRRAFSSPLPLPTHIVLHHGQLLILVPRRLCLIMLTK